MTKVPVAQTLIAYGLAPIRNRWTAHPASVERYRYSRLTLALGPGSPCAIRRRFQGIATATSARRVRRPNAGRRRSDDGMPTTSDYLKKNATFLNERVVASFECNVRFAAAMTFGHNRIGRLFCSKCPFTNF